MSHIEVIFRLALAHPLLIMDATDSDAKVHFSETENTVCVELVRGPWPEDPNDRGVFDVVLLHVHRDCAPEDRDESPYYAKLEEWGIVRDAATTLWRLLEYIRDEDFLLSRTVAGYPAAPSETPQANPVVQTARAEVIFDGDPLSTLPLGGVPSIQIARGVWDPRVSTLKRTR